MLLLCKIKHIIDSLLSQTTVIIDMAAFEIDDDVTFSANEFDEINKEETKKNLLNSAVLGILTRF